MTQKRLERCEKLIERMMHSDGVTESEVHILHTALWRNGLSIELRRKLWQNISYPIVDCRLTPQYEDKGRTWLKKIRKILPEKLRVLVDKCDHIVFTGFYDDPRTGHCYPVYRVISGYSWFSYFARPRSWVRDVPPIQIVNSFISR